MLRKFLQRFKRKIDFVIVGAQKSGTSAMYYYLKQHPQIAMSNLKELHFFDNDELFKNGKPDYTLLHKHFRLFDNSKIKGECTPIYMFWEPSMQRIHDYNPNIKIIAILRNPVERAFSQWNMRKANGRTSVDFLEAVRNERGQLKELPQSRESYIGRGMYLSQLQRIFSLFRKENVLVLKYEDFKKDPVSTLNKVFEFLGADKSLSTFKEKKLNELEYFREMKPEEKQFLLDVFKNDIDEVEKLLGWDCNDWRA